MSSVPPHMSAPDASQSLSIPASAPAAASLSGTAAGSEASLAGSGISPGSGSGSGPGFGPGLGPILDPGLDPGPGAALGGDGGSAPLSATITASSSQTLLSEPSAMKLTRGHSCVLCQQRKVRCDKNKPCANCVRAQVECRVVPPAPPRRRKKKPQERDLVERLRRYEALLSQNGVSFEPLAHEFRQLPLSLSSSAAAAAAAAAGAAAADVDELQHDLVGLKTSPSSSNPECAEPPRWTPPKDAYKDYRSHDESSDEELEDATIHQAFDSMYESQDGFPFVIGGSAVRVTDSHPHGIQIFQLWQIYLTNVNPLLKVTHTQTLQAQIIEAGANVGRIARPLEALMFSIYLAAVTSMAEDEVQSTFDEDKARLIARYHRAAQQALINAGFMRSPDILVLQAYFLYLVSLIPIALPTYQQPQICVRQFVDPRSLFCLIGIAVRIAQRLGLHRDGAQFGLPPFEIELRRRLWWQIVAFDKRIAEITGSAITALSTSGADTLFPLNINDTDLHLHAKDPPTPYAGPTEMLFCLTRVEMCMAGGGGGSGGGGSGGGSGSGSGTGSGSSGSAGAHRFHYSPSPSSPDIITHVANQTLPSDPESFCAYMEHTYLKACDPKIPLHFFTILMTRQALCKMRIITFLARSAPTGDGRPGGPTAGGPMGLMDRMMGGAAGHAGGPSPPPPPPPVADDAERDILFMEAVHMIEYDNVLQRAESLRGFVWYTYMHFPFPAYMFLVVELRHRRRFGELADRAWDAICENHDCRRLIRNLRSPIHVALGPLFIKAWDAHEAAVVSQGGGPLAMPRFIQMLRQTVPKAKQLPTVSAVSASSSQRPLPSAAASSSEVIMQEPASSTTTSSSPVGLPPSQQPQPQQPQLQTQPQPPVVYTTPAGTTADFGIMGGGGQQAALGAVPIPDMVDFGPMDWSFFVQGMPGEFGGNFGGGCGGAGGGAGAGASFGSMYGQPGGQE